MSEISILAIDITISIASQRRNSSIGRALKTSGAPLCEMANVWPMPTISPVRVSGAVALRSEACTVQHPAMDIVERAEGGTGSGGLLDPVQCLAGDLHHVLLARIGRADGDTGLDADVIAAERGGKFDQHLVAVCDGARRPDAAPEKRTAPLSAPSVVPGRAASIAACVAASASTPARRTIANSSGDLTSLWPRTIPDASTSVPNPANAASTMRPLAAVRP
mgnify:CR=1 FL=1